MYKSGREDIPKLYLRAGATVRLFLLLLSGGKSTCLFLFEGQTVSYDQFFQLGRFEACPKERAESRRGLMAVLAVDARETRAFVRCETVDGGRVGSGALCAVRGVRTAGMGRVSPP